MNSLAGKRIGFLWDDMFRGDEIFALLKDHISQLEPTAQFVDHTEFGPIFGGDEHAVLDALPERLRSLGIDAVISGNGC